MAKSLPPISAKVIADAEQYVAELKRADRATKTFGSQVDKELDALGRKVKRKFSLADIGTSVLSGLGLGSGFAIAEKAIDLIASRYADAAKAQLIMEESAARQLAITKEILAVGQTDEQRLDSMIAEATELYKKRQALLEQQYDTITKTDREGNEFTVSTPRARSSEDEKKLADLTAAYDKLRVSVAKLRKELQDKAVTERATEAERDQEARIRNGTAYLREREAAFDALLKKQDEHADATARANKEEEVLADRIRAMSDPLFEYKKNLEDLEKARAKLTAAEYAAAKVAIENKEKARQVSDVSSELDDFFGNIDQASRKFKDVTNGARAFETEMNQLWNSISDRAGQTFADMLLEGEMTFGNLANMVSRAVIEMVSRLAIINPILNALFGGATGVLPALFSIGGAVAGGAAGAAGAASSGGAGIIDAGAFSTTMAPVMASGGSAEAGITYRVNEDGQEFFRASVGGTIIPVGASGHLRGESQPTKVFNFTYHIPAGVTHAELLPILKAQERRTIAALRDADRRGI
ncbi:hypothetical protein [Opitutus sp. ER46]|uniref:hypothetical protein n=1 Tax=Opitutus sp. ER46 TaxID=2161864 RepID=UPI0018EE5803|nr:hypothetical protein [Opitutus sp. ER46]